MKLYSYNVSIVFSKLKTQNSKFYVMCCSYNSIDVKRTHFFKNSGQGSGVTTNE